MVKIGLELIGKRWPERLKNKNTGLLCHPPSINANYDHASDIVSQAPFIVLRCFFGPQHGIRGETQANMVQWEGFNDPKTHLPVHSLYGKHRKPIYSMLEDIDLLVIDIFDIGARYYTYIWTMAYCLEACENFNKSIVVLDRPNPLNALDIEGPVVNENFYSFIGLKKLSIRHGMTVGEIALYLKGEYYKSLDLSIIPMEGYKRDMYFEDTGLPWVMPSPNIPTMDTAIVYPGMCLLEGTNLSEGRGTTRPFELFGAPFIDAERLSAELNNVRLPGVLFRPVYFQPTFDKFQGQLCSGSQLHVLERQAFKPFYTGVAIIKTVMDMYPENFRWNEGPYEYETKKKPIDILFGTDTIRLLLEEGASLSKIKESYSKNLCEFRKIRQNYLLYT
ncbi:MAG: exo-beta-N-acetylmuramidase NamZ domain-containing protein [bacterium]